MTHYSAPLPITSLLCNFRAAKNLKKFFVWGCLLLKLHILNQSICKWTLPPAAANVKVHLAAMNTGFRSDIGLAVIIFPPTAWKEFVLLSIFLRVTDRSQVLTEEITFKMNVIFNKLLHENKNLLIKQLSFPTCSTLRKWQQIKILLKTCTHPNISNLVTCKPLKHVKYCCEPSCLVFCQI